MKICIITHVQHVKSNNQYYGYAPYVREMNLWLQNVSTVIIVAPLTSKEISDIDLAYEKDKIIFVPVSEFNIVNFGNALKSLISLPKIVFHIYKAMQSADHIHLRCPGNMGLLGSFVQIFFPKKKKTVKYAGNWDPKSKQPWSYRLQKWIVSNIFLSRNMTVLVYGEWTNQTKNIKPFFTATYSQSEIQNSEFRIQNNTLPIQFLFVGTLTKGKQPLYSIQIIEKLNALGVKVSLEVYGDGVLRKKLEQYVQAKELEKAITFKGNQSKDVVKQAYQHSQFLLLPSKSEGWPKAVAEAMFWGCVPIATPVSCVPYILHTGERGILLEENLEEDVQSILKLIQSADGEFEEMREKAQKWSQQFTLELLEKEIAKLLQ